MSNKNHYADRVLINGTIITMDAANSIAQAVAIKDGTIQAVGEISTIKPFIGEHTIVDDFNGLTCLPGFIDAHSHFTLTGLTLVSINVSSPPRGTVGSIEELKQRLMEYKKNMKPDAFPWIIGTLYDNTALQEQRHPTRHDLDQVSTDIPIFVLHSSGHMGVANSKALELAGITASSKEVQGGKIYRNPGSQEPTGLLEEHALLPLFAVIPKPDAPLANAILAQALHAYAAQGITTAQEGFAAYAIVELLKQASQNSILTIDVVAYASYVECQRIFASWDSAKTYNHFNLAGIKIIVDGSIQGYTAYLTEPYFKVPADKSAGYKGYPAFADQNELNALVLEALHNNWQIIAHANGDAAIDQLLVALQKGLSECPRSDHRSVIIHAQTIRPDQLALAKKLGVMPSYFPGHVYYWGDKHRDIFLGPERAQHLDPAQSTEHRAMRYTFHHDSPVTPLSMIDILWFAVNRHTLSGVLLGGNERVSVLQALRAITINAAWQYFQEDCKGSLEVGKMADIVVLSDNPLTIEPIDLRSLKVMQTIKQGTTIYKKE